MDEKILILESEQNKKLKEIQGVMEVSIEKKRIETKEDTKRMDEKFILMKEAEKVELPKKIEEVEGKTCKWTWDPENCHKSLVISDNSVGMVKGENGSRCLEIKSSLMEFINGKLR